MAFCPEVITGHVEDPSEDYLRIQQAVDQGRNLWRLDPVKTAQVVGVLFGLEPTDQYTLVETFYDPGSGLQHAVVHVQHGPCSYLAILYQPVRQGPSGIWVLQRIVPL